MSVITLNESPKPGDELELFPLSLPVGFTARRHPRIVRSKRRVNAFVMMWLRDGMALVGLPASYFCGGRTWLHRLPKKIALSK